MAAESTKLNDIQQRQLIRLAQYLLPVLSKGGAPAYTFVVTNIHGHGLEGDNQIGLRMPNGNFYSIEQLLFKTFFEQIIHWNEYEFERDSTTNEQIKRPAPLVTGLKIDHERASCFAWIEMQHLNNKRGADVLDWHIMQVKKIFSFDVDLPPPQ